MAAQQVVRFPARKQARTIGDIAIAVERAPIEQVERELIARMERVLQLMRQQPRDDLTTQAQTVRELLALGALVYRAVFELSEIAEVRPEMPVEEVARRRLSGLAKHLIVAALSLLTGACMGVNLDLNVSCRDWKALTASPAAVSRPVGDAPGSASPARSAGPFPPY